MEGYAGICTCRHDVGRRCYACVRVYTVNMVPCVCACYVRTIADVQYARISYTNLRACIYRDLCTSSTVLVWMRSLHGRLIHNVDPSCVLHYTV